MVFVFIDTGYEKYFVFLTSFILSLAYSYLIMVEYFFFIYQYFKVLQSIVICFMGVTSYYSDLSHSKGNISRFIVIIICLHE